MKLYRCDLCGRVFHEITPHVCVHGNYRKRNLTFTELEDVDCEYVKKSKVDVKENFSTKIWQGPHMITEPLVSDIEFSVNWEQVRAYAAIAAMEGKLADHNAMCKLWRLDCEDPHSFNKMIAEMSVSIADALISELKRKDDGEEV